MVSAIAPARQYRLTALTLTLALTIFVDCRHIETAQREQPGAVTTPQTTARAVTTPQTTARAITTPQTTTSAVTTPQTTTSAVTTPQTTTSAVATPTPKPISSAAITENAPTPNQNVSDTVSKPVDTKKPCLLLAVGDSLTDPKSAGGGYLTQVKDHCGCSLVNLGKGGDMVNQMRARLLDHLGTTPNRYSDVLIFGGVNDLYSDQTAHRTVERISRDLTAMYLAARNHGARVVAVTVAPWGGFRNWYNPSRAASTRTLNDFIAASPKQGLTDYSVDAYAALSCGDPERLCDRYATPFKDGLHFGPLGHVQLGMALVQVLGKERCSVGPDAGSTSNVAREPSTEVTTKR